MVDDQSLHLDRCVFSHLCFPTILLGVLGRLWAEDGNEETTGARVEVLRQKILGRTTLFL